MAFANPLKQALATQQRQIGLWCSLGHNITIEIVAGSGFDWLVLDMEHSPNDFRSVLTQLQVVAAYPTEAVVRLPDGNPSRIKQYLDIGVRSFVFPNVNSATEAAALVAATRYPTQGGIRGVSLAQRANRFGRIKNYHANAYKDICIIAQIETPEAVNEAESIAQVDGIDALFVGPSDLSTNMGHLIEPKQPAVQDAIIQVQKSAQRAGKPVGILAPVQEDAEYYLSLGYTLVAVGSDQGLLIAASDRLAQTFKT